MLQDQLGDGSLGPEMVIVPAGSFMMGSPEGEEGREKNEGPQRLVTIGKPFKMGVNEVTAGEFRKFVEAEKYYTDAETGDGCNYWVGSWKKDSTKNWRSPGFHQGENHPVVCVSWSDARQYVEWLKAQTGKSYRLPSEAEWEYAARGGESSAYWWGDDPKLGKAVCDGCGSDWPAKLDERTAPTDAPGFEPNGFGLYHTAGNVRELVQDCYRASHEKALTDGRARDTEYVSDCRSRVARGGDWWSPPVQMRSANRSWDYPVNRYYFVGFRLAQDM